MWEGERWKVREFTVSESKTRALSRTVQTNCFLTVTVSKFEFFCLVPLQHAAIGRLPIPTTSGMRQYSNTVVGQSRSRTRLTSRESLVPATRMTVPIQGSIVALVGGFLACVCRVWSRPDRRRSGWSDRTTHRQQQAIKAKALRGSTTSLLSFHLHLFFQEKP